MRNSKIKILLLLVFLSGLSLRLLGLSSFPVGLTPDEAAQGYSAKALLETGKDEWGKAWPLNLRSFGDFKPPLQTYLMIPSVAVFGLNKLALRLPNALLGSLAVVGVFFLTSQLFKNKILGLIASFLIAFSPWHILLSRGAFEANLTVFFSSFGFWFLLKALEEKKFSDQILSGLFLGLNLFSYHSAKLVTPLALFLVFGFYSHFKLKKMTKNIFANKFLLIVFGLFFIPAFSSFLSGGQQRGLDIALFNPTDNWQAVSDSRWWAIKGMGLPDIVARIFNNKLVYSVEKIVENFLTFISPQFLFSQGPSEATYGMMPGVGVLYFWELPIVIWSAYRLIKKPKKEVWLLLVLALIGSIPASIAKGERAANRAATMMPYLQIILAWGLFELINNLKGLKKIKKLVIFGFILVFLFFFASFLEDYFIQSPAKFADQMLYGRCQALVWVEQNFPEAKKVIVSRKLSEPQAYVMFCLDYPVELSQAESQDWLRYRQQGASFLDQLGEYHLGKFVFKEINWASDSLIEDVVLIGKTEEFPGTDFKPIKQINYPNGQTAIYIYSNVGQIYAQENF